MKVQSRACPRHRQSGDLVFAGAHGRCKSTDFGGILRILDALSEFECDTVVPGHGVPVVGGGAEAIATYRDYLVTLQERVAELADSGVGLEETKTRFGDWKFADWGRPELLPTAIEHAYKDYVWRASFFQVPGAARRAEEIMPALMRDPRPARGAG